MKKDQSFRMDRNERRIYELGYKRGYQKGYRAGKLANVRAMKEAMTINGGYAEKYVIKGITAKLK